MLRGEIPSGATKCNGGFIMICKNCGNTIENNLRFCTHCGAMLDQNQIQEDAQSNAQNDAGNAYQQPDSQANSQYRPGLSYEDFYKEVVSKNSGGFPKWMAIICFITAAVSLIFLFMGNVLAILDIAVYMLAGFMLNKTKTKLWALIPTVYGGIFTVIALANGGSISGIVALVVGVQSVVVLNKVEKAYAEYQKTGYLPEKKI